MQQELIEEKQKAEVSNKLTTSLLANMNHELRTPMNGILGFAEILMNDLKEEDAKSKAENILVSGRRLMDTLDAIMDLSYLESDKVSRKFKPILVLKTVKSVVRSYEQAIRRKKLILELDIPDHLAILGDDHLFQHLVKNLLDNAVKYTEQGSITITASLVQRDDKTMVLFSVKDTGIGISTEHYRMIFEAFRQVSEGYGRQFEGSGLGLTISKRIVDIMNGEISLSSSVNQGSEFQVLLVSATDLKPDALISREEVLKPKIHPDGGRKLPDVLIVEDNLVNIQLLMIYIRKYCNIYTTLDAKSAIQLSRERKFDAILMDINLGPGMDGIQAMLEIRKNPDYYDTPILAVTGYASIGDRERLITIGFNGYIPKPYDKVTIAAMMMELFPV
jgi:CheY-like chemotaxis protein